MRNVFRLLMLTIFAIVIMAFLLLGVSPSLIIKNLINKHSESLIGIKMKCSGVRISLFKGTGSIRDLQIYNPSDNNNYFYKNLMTLDKLQFTINRKELLNKLIHINNITFSSLSMNYEQYVEFSNLSKIIAKIKQRTGLPIFDKDDEKKESKINVVNEASSYNFIIDEITIKDIKVNFYLAPLGKEMPIINIPDITLRHIGGESGVNISNVVKDVLFSINQKILSDAAATNKNATEQIKNNIQDKAGDVIKHIRDMGSNFFKGGNDTEQPSSASATSTSTPQRPEVHDVAPISAPSDTNNAPSTTTNMPTNTPSSSSNTSSTVVPINSSSATSSAPTTTNVPTSSSLVNTPSSAVSSTAQ